MLDAGETREVLGMSADNIQLQAEGHHGCEISASDNEAIARKLLFNCLYLMSILVLVRLNPVEISNRNWVYFRNSMRIHL